MQMMYEVSRPLLDRVSMMLNAIEDPMTMMARKNVKKNVTVRALIGMFKPG